jgi:tryptophan synthase alpha subunit
LSSAGILPLGINVANPQLSGKKVAQQQAVTLSSSLTQPILQQQAQARQLTAGKLFYLNLIMRKPVEYVVDQRGLSLNYRPYPIYVCAKA